MECRVGRAVRASGHDLLPDSDRTVNVYLHIAALPKEMPSSSTKSKGGTEELTWPQETADQIMWKQVQSEREEMSAILNDFKSRAADFNILRSAMARQ